jgi:hypothetical protein
MVKKENVSKPGATFFVILMISNKWWKDVPIHTSL